MFVIIIILTDIDILAMTAIALLPTLRQKQIDERYIFGGPFLLFFGGSYPGFIGYHRGIGFSRSLVSSGASVLSSTSAFGRLLSLPF